MELGTEFIQAGVKAVVTVSWPVQDRTAHAFAESFYQELLTGVRFVDAIRATRLKIWDQFPDEAAWGAYQCYGDPDWRLVKPEAQAPALEDIEKQSGLSVGAMMDQKNLEEFGPGLFRIEPGSELRLTPASVRESAGEEPWLILIHALSSNIRGSFGPLWEPQAISRWQSLLHRYGERALAFQFASLGRSPLESALFLAQALPPNARLHLLTLSESGLIGELLARSQRVGNTAPFDEQDLALLAGHAEERLRLEHLSRVLQAKRFRIERFLRVACPAQGSRLFERLPALGKDLFSALSPAWLMGQAGTWVMRQFADPRRMPGMAALLPDAPLIQLLNRPDVSTEAELSVVVGVSRSTTFNFQAAGIADGKVLGRGHRSARGSRIGPSRNAPLWPRLDRPLRRRISQPLQLFQKPGQYGSDSGPAGIQPTGAFVAAADHRSRPVEGGWEQYAGTEGLAGLGAGPCTPAARNGVGRIPKLSFHPPPMGSPAL